MSAISRPSALRQPGIASTGWGLSLVGVAVASGSIVLVEPAPYDLICMGLLVSLLALGLRIPRGIGLAIALMLFYLLANVIASMLAPDPTETVRPLATRIFLALTWLLFTCVIYEQPLRVLTIVWRGYVFAALIALVAGLVGWLDIVPGASELFLKYGRMSGTFKDPNVFGPFLVPATLYLLSRIEVRTGLRAYFDIALFSMMLLGILLSFSRGAWLDLVVATGTYVCLRFATVRVAKQRARLMAIVMASALVGTTGLVWMVTKTSAGDLFSIRAVVVQDYDVDASEGRLTAQRAALQRVVSEPFGIGPSQSERVFGVPPHNLFIHVVIEAGWIGGVMFWSFLVVTMWKTWQFCLCAGDMQRIAIVVFASLVGTLVQSLFIDSTHWRHLFLLLAMAWGPVLAWSETSAQRGGFACRT